MSEAEVIYSEVQFGSGARGCTNVSQQGAAELRGPAQVRRRDVALLVLSLLLAAAVSALAASLYESVQTKDQLQKLERNLSDELLKLQSYNKDLEGKVLGQSCLTCEEDWEQHGGQCYRFSSSYLSWTKSKDNCKKQGGDLVKIDSREEQTFLRNKVKYSGNLFWIGLTDSDTEGDWKWVDGSALKKSLSFWADNEPNDWKVYDPNGEDCVLMGEGWWDYSCKYELRWICEKQAEQ